MIVDDSVRKLSIPPKLNLKLRSESEAKSHHFLPREIDTKAYDFSVGAFFGFGTLMNLLSP